MTETTITADGTRWYRNPFPDAVGKKWIRIDGCICLLRAGFPLKEFPMDMQCAIEDYIKAREKIGR